MIHEAINNIQYNVALSFDILLPVPRVVFLNNLTQEEKDEIRQAGGHYVYPHMAIERVKGLDVSAMAFYQNGFSLYTLLTNDNALLDGGQGPKLQANAVTAWAGKVKVLDKCWKKLEEKMREQMPDFIGFICLDVTLAKNKAYYRLIDFQPPEDYIKAVEALAGHRVDIILSHLSEGSMERPEGYGATLRLYDYPYDEDANMNLMYEYGLETIAETCEDALCVKGHGRTVKQTWKNIYQKIPRSQGICFRTDGDKLPRYTVNELQRGRFVE